MKIIQTFWPGPASRKPDSMLNFSAGWLSPEYHWMSWALSALQAKKIFGEITLITDSSGKQILIDILELPYSEVSTALEGKLDHYPGNLWSLAKIYSYSIQSEPFLHLDGDVILWARPEKELTGAALVCQNLEKNLFFYKAMLDEINKHFSYIPAVFSKAYYEGRDIYSCNAGFFGGNNLAFIKDYCREAFRFIDKNQEHWDKIAGTNLNFIFEQYLLYHHAQLNKVKITCYMEDIVDDPLYKDYVRFQDLPFVPMIHPVGGFKKMDFVCNNIAKKLRNEYPDYYYRIIDRLSADGIDMHSRIYAYLRPAANKKPSADTAIFKELAGEKGYERTLMALNYLNAKYKAAEISVDPSLVYQPGFEASIDEMSIEPDEKERLSEIHNLELQKLNLADRLYTDEAALLKHYNKDLNTYADIQPVFSMPGEQLPALTVCIDPAVLIIDLNWKWVHDDSTKIQEVVEQNFGLEKSLNQAAIIPSVLQLDISEYYLDELDMLIADFCKEPIELKEIMQQAKEYFNAEEIEANFAAYRNLISDCIKRLLYAGILSMDTE